jgi:UDP-N-acetylmuramoylalanine--D-glutamate ligase
MATMTETVRPQAPPRLRGARVLVVGAQRSGASMTRFLLEQGAAVTLTDLKAAGSLPKAIEELRRRGARLELGGHDEASFLGADLIAVSPGVPLVSPPLLSARRRGVPIVAEVELASWFLTGSIVGITGSNGKSTTTALCGHLLRHAGLGAAACGNIGTPLMEMASDDAPDRTYVVELSSFQLEGIETFRPRIAVLLNLSPDHQDRYPDVRAYYDAKARIFMNQGPGDHAVLNHDDPEVLSLSGSVAAARHLFSRCAEVEDGAFVRQGEFVLRRGGRTTGVMPVAEAPLFGGHNQENVMAALLVADLCGVPLPVAAEGVRSFRGLPHRLEKVGERGGVAWFNDSKATNVGAARQSLLTFRDRVVLILGGRDKGGDFASLAPLIRERVAHLILMGEARESILRQIGPVAPAVMVLTMAEAVEAAARLAAPGGVVLLAPACASFDQYAGFEERGEDFRRLVLALPAGPAPEPAGGPGPAGDADPAPGAGR